MDHPNPKFHNHQFRIIIKFLLSFSLLHVLLSLLLPLLLQFLTYTIDKSYMFLLCNGLLVFIAMSSGLINASSSQRITHQTIEEEEEAIALYDYNNRSSHLEFNASVIELASPLADETVMEIESLPPQEEKSLEIVEQQQEEEEDEDEGNELMIIDEDEHGIEELNKKCEEFIRKMKAAICSEPRADHFGNQKAMVAVN